MARKTIDIVELLEDVNSRNCGSSCDAECRNGWNSLLEGILMNADVYAGFGYVQENQLKNAAIGQKPGMILRSIEDGGNVFPDESRKIYYTHQKLRKK